jgi:hypothetical protein
VSILEDYRRFQEEQRAKGIDPSVAPRLTQEEQDILRQEIAATSSEPTTAFQPPSEDVSSPNLFTESRTQTQARESVGEGGLTLKQQFNEHKDALKLMGYDYMNPGDLDYIYDEIAKEFEKAGLQNINDLGKRTVDVSEQNVEVEQFTDPNTGKTKYRYTTGMVGFGGTGAKTIEVDPSLVKEVGTRPLGQGATEKMYMATLPNTMTELYNKKTGEKVDLFQSGGTLYGGLSGGEESTKFGSLYSNVEGGADLNVEFMEDGTPMIYPLYKDTSDKKLISAAVMVGGFALGGFGATGKLGNVLSGGKLASTSVGAEALGVAALGGVGGYAAGGDFKSAAIGAILAGATTYGLKSGLVGDILVNDFNVPESWLNGNNPLGVEIPIGDANRAQALSHDYINKGYRLETGLDGYTQVFDANNLPLGAETDLLNKTFTSFPNSKLTIMNADGTMSVSEYTAPGFGVGGGGGAAISTTNYGVDAATGGFSQIGETVVTPFDMSPAGIAERNLQAIQDIDPSVMSQTEKDILINEISESGGMFGGLSDTAKDIATKAGGVLGATGIDLKGIFGENIGGAIQNLVGTGIDYTALQEQEKVLEQRGRDIQAEYAGLFKPYTVRTGLGVGTITPEEAVSVADVAYQPIRTAQLGAARGMFEDLPTTREEATAQQLAATRALTEPQRQREQERMLGTLAQRGLLGYGQTMPTVGGERRVSPIAESILSAQETARAQEALAAQQFGLTEAGRQQQLGAGLLRGAQTIDEAAMAGLTRAQDISATLQQRPEMAGLGARAQYEQLAALSEYERLRGLQSGARGLFGLPTQQGNVDIEQLTKALELARVLQQTQPKTATG